MPTLTNEQKALVVSAFARLEGVAEVCRLFKEQYGAEITKSHALSYNPGRAHYRSSPKWHDLFDRERKSFLNNVSSIGIANKAFRIQQLHKLCAIAMKRNNIKLAAEILEQAAKEMGEVFTNRREVKSENKSITATMTTEELRQEILNDLKQLGVDTPPALLPRLGPRAAEFRCQPAPRRASWHATFPPLAADPYPAAVIRQESDAGPDQGFPDGLNTPATR
jgi:hypothetical protein